MKDCKLILILVLFSLKTIAQNTAKPWAYWWWPGSAVNKSDLKANLQSYADAGFGGLHIIPIYGVKGEEDNFLYYLSPKYIEHLKFCTETARELGLGIDMSLGTGWPFGGKNVTKEMAAKSLILDKDSSGNFNASFKNTNQKVKRAAPGGEGLVLDHFSKEATEKYFAVFDSVFSKENIRVRAFYSDSYEVYGANWTENFLEKFKAYRKYDLQPFLSSLTKTENLTEVDKQIWHDYQETISDLLLDGFTTSFTDFAHKFNKINRNESHGSPANILDLYAASDVPESEFFGSKPYDIKNYRQDPDYSEKQFGKPNLSVLKLASSPAHLLGKKLVSSETATWLGNHFKVSLAQIKPIIDESFLGGINHVFYHGIPYSPHSAGFPGWLFYASTNFNQNSHFYKELPLLNKYIENAQTLLQNSQPDNQVLLYLPIHDLWHEAKENLHLIDVHNIEKNGLFTPEYREIIKQLNENGYQFDFISDRQIAELKKENGGFGIGNFNYKAIVIPETEYFPMGTLDNIVSLSKIGLKTIILNKTPQKVSGLLDWQQNQKLFEQKIKNLKPFVSTNIIENLKKYNIKKESLSQTGLQFLRKKTSDETIYFLANQNTKFNVGNIEFNTTAKNVYLFDAISGVKNKIDFVIKNNKTLINIYLPSGKSTFFIFSNKAENLEKTDFMEFKNRKQISGNWTLTFKEGEPFMPHNQSYTELKSWTETVDTLAHYFSGIGEYTTTFELGKDAINKPALLSLGDVRESAKVSINGIEIGIAWSLPFELSIPQYILKEKNELKIEVRNVSANRMIYLDKQKVNWKKFYDINMVDIQYKPFNASNWKPVYSGLLGPVILKY
ncbi:glycoside hydrolase [Lacihabitans sp. LS3-19]|uniref:glycosyl hydrolase n=1 Tax=Lacihabitans sp. LS3-19 TaxID=2487335 RepID=UPI0020CE5DDC|nr:glycosyl hydrolase [Lacihabitans sp. LS3-19]MCP9769021.1 glycoside hydrolase [Lacihabitans sp. LS3-19]